MATRTLGTNATTTLTAIRFGQDVSDADFASIINGILDDYNMGQQPYNASTGLAPATPRIYPGAFSRSGRLFIPNRGVLTVRPGDYVAIDATGWPILVGNNAINDTSPPSSWTHT